MSVEGGRTGPGRPREFCADAALAAALEVFWRQGFNGASLGDLTRAMGISRPSLYAAFGNKEALFRQALALYEREKLGFVEAALAAPTARGVAERMLAGALALQAGADGPRGCLVMQTIACGGDAGFVQAELLARGAAAEAALVGRFERAAAAGELAEGVSAGGLARLLLTLVQGMAVQAAGGGSREALAGVVETALRVWPSW